MTILKLNNIDAGYGNKQVLFNVSLALNEGELMLITGSNGSGKSTLFKVIFGLIIPWNNKSEIVFNNEDISKFNPEQLIKKGIVYIPQKNELFEEMTVLENIEVAAMMTISKKEIKERIELLTAKLPILKNILNQKCNKLSGGERKNTSFAMALINNPKLLILDEPLAGVSPNFCRSIINQIITFKKNGISILLIEHRISNIIDISDRILGLRYGKVFGNFNIDENFDKNQLTGIYV